jgi:hypothetical protein
VAYETAGVMPPLVLEKFCVVRAPLEPKLRNVLVVPAPLSATLLRNRMVLLTRYVPVGTKTAVPADALLMQACIAGPSSVFPFAANPVQVADV